MKAQPNFLELFSGVGGMGYGLMQAGWNCNGYVECDTHCGKCKTYTRHNEHPSKPFYTVCATCGTAKHQQTHHSYQIIHDPHERMWHRYDVTTVTDDDIRRFRDERGHISLIAAGFPCQAFSVAGKREGFADQTRGTLFFEVVRFASILRPSHLLLENVDGLRNHDGGRTLGIILSTLDEMGYDVEWQVINSSAYIPQNRERIYIVASLRGQRARKIFPIIGQDKCTIEVVGSIPGKFEHRSRIYGAGGVAPTLGAMQGGGQEPRVLVKGNVNPSGNGMNGNVFDANGLAPTLTTNKGEGVKVFLNQERYGEYKPSEVCQTVRVGGDPLLAIEPRAVLTPDRAEKRQNGRRMKEPDEPMFTLTAQDLHGVAVKKVGHLPSDNGQTGAVYATDGIAPTQLKQHGNAVTKILDQWAIRKLTPLECFRLQTYPVEWYVKLKLYKHPEYITSIDISRNDVTAQVMELIQREGIKEGMSDSQLYKMAGNGVTSAVAEDIGARLLHSI